MKKPRSFLTFILVSACLPLYLCAWASSDHTRTQGTPLMYPGGQSRIVIRAAGRGNPSISFNDGVELSTSYPTSIDGQYQLSQKLAQLRAMASADFDEDGSPDLIVGHALHEGGILSLYRGNVDSLYPNSPEA